MGELGDLVDVQNRAGSDLVFQKFLFGLDPVDVPEPPGGEGVGLDQHLQGVPAAHLFEDGILVDQPAKLGEVPLNTHADAVPQPVGLTADHHVAVTAGIPLVLVEVGVPAARPRLDGGVEHVPADIKVQDVHLGLGAGHLAKLALTGELVPPVQGRQQGVGPLLTGDKIREPDAGPGGGAAALSGELVLGKAGVVDEGVGAATKGLEGPLAELGRLVLVGAPGAANRHVQIDQPGEFLGKVPVALDQDCPCSPRASHRSPRRPG